MRNLFVWLIMAACLFVPVDVIRIAAAFLLMAYFPGVLLWSFVDSEENPLIFLLCGAAFLTVFVYYCSWFVFFPIPLILSFICVLFLEKKKIPSPRIDKKTVFLLGFILFMITCLYPWKDYVAFYPPGDEMKLHLLYTNAIITDRAFPKSYPLYPEIQEIAQPLGFHGVTALVQGASRTFIMPAAALTGIFMASLGCIAIYFLGKTLFSEETALTSAFSFAFLSFVSHQLGFSGSYTVLAGITFQISAVAAVLKASKQKTRSSYILAGLFCAASFSTDLNLFLPLILFLILLLAMNRYLLPVLAAFVLFSLPQLSRLAIYVPTSLESHFLEEWFQQNSITSFGELWILLFSVGPLLLTAALLHTLSVHGLNCPLRKLMHIEMPYLYLGLYTLSLLIPILLARFSFWYFMNPSLLFRMVCIPLSVLSGLFLVQLNSLRQIKSFLFGLILFSAVIHWTDPFAILPSLSTVNPDALSAYHWISQNTAPGASFCNFASSGDSSTWIPAVVNRRVFLPFHLYYERDNAMSRLKLPERFTDAAILKAIPDSVFAKDILEKYEFSYVYIDDRSPIDPEIFLNSHLYRLEFQKGSVYVFSVTDADAPPYRAVRYYPGEDISYRFKSYFHFPDLREGNIIGIYYTDSGFGNVDVEINGEYLGTIFRFNSHNHFLALFVLPSLGDINVSFLPYDEVFCIDYLIIFECGEESIQ